MLMLVLTAGDTYIVHAQTVPGSTPLVVDVSPQYPAPFQSITINPSSTLFDLGASIITVSINGTSYYKGTGSTPIQARVGGPGTATTVLVTATVGGASYKKSITIRPASVALVVEPISTTHPFYAGTGLVSPEGHVRLVAIPDLRSSAGKPLDPATLIYTWKLGDQILESASGIGQSVLDATAPERYRDAPVSVTVTNADSSLIAQAQTTISPVDPIVHMYRDDPLLGPLFDTALSDIIAMTTDEDTYRGVGYYFSQTPAVTWTVNGNNSGSDSDITVRSAGSGAGSAIVNFAATTESNSQSTDQSTTVNFGKKSGGFFGL